LIKNIINIFGYYGLVDKEKLADADMLRIYLMPTT